MVDHQMLRRSTKRKTIYPSFSFEQEIFLVVQLSQIFHKPRSFKNEWNMNIDKETWEC